MSIPEPKASEEIFNSESYQKFIDSMVSYCRCRAQDRPCDGVLAGGICDNIQDDPDGEEYDYDAT